MMDGGSRGWTRPTARPYWGDEAKGYHSWSINGKIPLNYWATEIVAHSQELSKIL